MCPFKSGLDPSFVMASYHDPISVDPLDTSEVALDDHFLYKVGLVLYLYKNVVQVLKI